MNVSKLLSQGLPFGSVVFFMLPFGLMLVIHEALRLSHALMVATPLGERVAHVYNLSMVVGCFSNSSNSRGEALDLATLLIRGQHRSS